MKKAQLVFFAFCLLSSVTLMAHHGTGGVFDTDTVITSKGTVTKFLWINPHVQINFNVVREDGSVEEWKTEGDPVNMMAETGWNKNSLKVGDVITVSYHPAKNGAKIGYAVKVVTPSGRCLARSSSWASLCSK